MNGRKKKGLLLLLSSCVVGYQASRGEKVPEELLPALLSIGQQGGMNKLEKQITGLLHRSKSAFEKQKSVDSIVKPFAKAQSLIHSDSFKQGLEGSRIRKQIVEDFANLGYKLSE